MKLKMILANMASKVIGMVLIASEVLKRGPSGIEQNENTTRVYWSMYGVDCSFVLNFEFDEKGSVKTYELIAAEPILSEKLRILLRAKAKMIFDRVAIKEVSSRD